MARCSHIDAPAASEKPRMSKGRERSLSTPQSLRKLWRGTHQQDEKAEGRNVPLGTGRFWAWYGDDLRERVRVCIGGVSTDINCLEALLRQTYLEAMKGDAVARRDVIELARLPLEAEKTAYLDVISFS